MEAPKHAFLDPRLYNSAAVISSNHIKIDEEQDRHIIDQWLAERGKFQLNYYQIRKPREVSLNATKQALKSCLEIVEKLDKTREELRCKVEVMSSQEWKQKTLDIGILKEKFDKAIVIFEDNTILKSLKGLVVSRSKKRRNQRNKRKRKQEMKKMKEEHRKECHKRIDKWLESKKEEVERVKMEEKMKKDADCVLYEVTKKKSEARKELSLISALVKLRNVRDSMAIQRGETPSLEDRQAFGSVTEKLIRMWESSYQNYCKEEQCLKLMLEDTVCKDTKAALMARQSRTVDQWERLLFGNGDIPNNSNIFLALTAADRELENFIAIRKSWDTFLSAEGSGIPLGSVLPNENARDEWKFYLQQ